MCRLYGFHANEETKVECSLVYAQNALMRQSRSDQRGSSHPDGWGIAVYGDARPSVEKRQTAAFRDLHFSLAAERIYARTVIAHVRQATVGVPSASNTHPFSHGGWVFAHNGTVRAMDKLGRRLLVEILPRLRRERLGSTDSELAFYWLLSRMAEAGVEIDDASSGDSSGPLTVLIDVLRQAVRELDSRCVAAGADQPAKLNFLMTDGRVMLVSRWRNSLFLLERRGVHDCEICGIPHVLHQPGSEYRAAVVASEAITHEAWAEVPEATLVAVDADLSVSLHPI